MKLKDNNIIFPIVHIPADPKPKPKPKPPKIKLVIGKGCSFPELEKAEEELYQEGLMSAAKAAEEFKNFANDKRNNNQVARLTILFDDINKRLTLDFDPRRESCTLRNVEKLKAFFKKHFEKE